MSSTARYSARIERSRRAAFTLIELLLALALIVVATGLIGYIMQMYARNFTTKADDIRRKQLAKAVLTMIAEDIRAVVLEQEYDGSVLQQQMGVSGGGQSGGGEAAGDASMAGASDVDSDWLKIRIPLLPTSAAMR